MEYCRLGINIDHVATLRNARGDVHPDPLRAAKMVKQSGGDGITVHLREDRRHIRDHDVFSIAEEVELPLNLEMAATNEMLEIALKVKPNACCIVPERREELTTEGGLNVSGQLTTLTPIVSELKKAGIRVSLFVDPDEDQLKASAKVGADIVELHTGSYANAEGAERSACLASIVNGAALTAELGLECHAGHGLNYGNVAPIAAILEMRELNIGHFLMGEAIFVGFETSIQTMRTIINEARA